MSKRVKAIIAFVLAIGLIISTPNFYAAAASPKLNKKAVTVTIGNTAELFVKNTTKTVKWSSSNKAVAKVDADGEVTAKKAGKAKITAKVGKKKYKCNVTVPKQYISSKSVFIHYTALDIGFNTGMKLMIKHFRVCGKPQLVR